MDIAVIDVTDSDGDDAIVFVSDGDETDPAPAEDGMDCDGARLVPSVQLRGIVACCKRVEKGLMQTVRLIEKNKKDMDVLRADARGMRGLLGLVQDQVADAAERTERMMTSNKVVVRTMADILDKLSVPGAVAAAGAGDGTLVGGVAVQGTPGAAGSGEGGPVVIPSAPWSADVRVR